VRKALEALPGVAHVTTDVSAQTATCAVEKDKFDAEKAIAALAEVGYDNSTVLE
jgi:copper chaperone CopZ